MSDDGGNTWLTLGHTWNTNGTDLRGATNNYHADHHAVAFSIEAPERIYMATDGGVFRAEDWRDPMTFTSTHNSGLRTLQFYSPAIAIEFIGSVGCTSGPRGITVGGTQDNGNLWKPDTSRGIWKPSEGDDGGDNAIIGQGGYVHRSKDHVTSVNFWNELTQSLENPSSIVPNGLPGSMRDTSGLKVVIEAVPHPVYRNKNGHLMHAIGINEGAVYGLFGTDTGRDLYWLFILPMILSDKETIGCVNSFDGEQLLIGTNKGRIFYANVVSGLTAEETSLNSIPADAIVNRIVFTSPQEAYGVFVPKSGIEIPVARWDGKTWNAVTPIGDNAMPGYPAEALGMDADDFQDPPVLMVSTDSTVWSSSDRGINWIAQSQGLPRRPHCTDLRFNRGKRRWILGTYGRSLWQAGKLKQVGVSSLIQSDFPIDAKHNNFEALILDGSELIHYWKDNGDARNGWIRHAKLTDRATAPACIIRSDYVLNAKHHNFEALVLEGNSLSHYVRDNNGNGEWSGHIIIPTDVMGPASLIQSDYRSDEHHGNFEALIPMSDGLWHWSCNNATGEWAPVKKLPVGVGSIGCITQSNYVSNPGHRNFEALVFEPRATPRDPDVLWHLYWDGTKWEKTQPVTRNALGPGSLIQGDYVKGSDHYNLEALAWERDPDTGRSIIRHYYRDDEHQKVSWTPSEIVSDRATGPASLLRSDFHSDPDHANFEAIVVEADNEVWHYWRDQSVEQWKSGGVVT